MRVDGFIAALVLSCRVTHLLLLLHSWTGIPNILALMSFLLLLMAERTASRRNPGHLSSFRISLQTRVAWSVSAKQLRNPPQT